MNKNTLPFLKKSLSFAIQLTLISIISQSIYADDSENSQAQQLDTIVVEAEGQNRASSEQQKGYTYNKARTATKLNLDLKETPQNVKVYTREYLDDRNIQSFQSFLNNVTGATVSRTDERQTTYARGFQMDYYLLDGIPTLINSFGSSDLDLSIFDRIEVVKGANGLMTGAGNPAMGVNLIRKHADAKEFTGKVNASAGSWNNYSTTADFSGALNEDGNLRGRFVIKRSDEDSFMDRYEKTRNVVYGALDYDLTDSTTLSLAASYQQLERQGIRWGGLPAFYTDGTRTNFDRKTTVSSDWTYWNIDTTAVFASIKQNLWNDINLNLAYSFRRDDEESALLYYGGRVNKQNNLGVIPAQSYVSGSTIEENNLDLFLNLPFTWSGREQEIVLGGTWNQNKKFDDRFGNPVLDNYILDFNRPTTNVIGNFSTPNRNGDQKTSQNGVYIASKFHLLDPLKLVAGARLSNWEYENQTGNVNREFNNEWTPYIGLIFDITLSHSLYASYTDIFKPQDRKGINGEYLDPIKGKNYETGIKSQFFDGRLNTALSIFRIEQTNVAEILDGVLIGPRLEQAYRAADGVVSKGFEFEADGQINDHWALNFGIANFEAKDAKDVKVNTNSARTTANLFAKYTQDQWKAGLGVNYRGEISRGTGVNKITQGDVFLMSAMLGYKIDDQFNVQLNLDNILDKKYYEGVAENSMNYATPRSATLSLQYQF